MYITELKIRNVKILRNFKLKFGEPDKPRMWTALIGVNGSCKTAILQCIAMAASGQDRSNRLVDAATLPDRRSQEPARIEGIFTFPPGGHSRRLYPGLAEGKRKRIPGLRSSIVATPGNNRVRGGSQYFSLNGGSARSFQASQPFTVGNLLEEGFLKELATVFGTEEEAFRLLDALGPVKRIPEFDPENPLGFWQTVAVELDRGLLFEGLARLVTAAAGFHPDNPKLERWAAISNRVENMSDPLEAARAKDLPDWFFAAYGTSRLLPRPLAGQRPRNPSLERVGTLFEEGKIIGTEFARILDDHDSFTNAMREALIESLLLPSATDIELRDRGWARSADDIVEGDLVTLRQGQDNVVIPATWLSQGYQSIMSWIADLVGWFYFEHQQPVPLDQMEGLVLIDEIDLHLHPAWQQSLSKALRKIFPRLQFVVTTHSEMVLTGLKPEEIVILTQDQNGNVIPEQIDDIPALMTGSQIQDRYFRVRRTQAARLGAALRRHGILSKADPKLLDEEDRQELASLHHQLVEAGIDPESGRPL